MNKELLMIYESLESKNQNEKHYLDSVKSFFEALGDNLFVETEFINKFIKPQYIRHFFVEWVDDDGIKQINEGWRVQHSNIVGVFKGGIRFNKGVNLDILKALAFEQTFKNSLTGLPLGGAKGGSDFDPKGKSEGEKERFITAFMEKLSPYLGSDYDVPAGDLGVSQVEVTKMQKIYEAFTNSKDITFTSKLINYGGSFLRPEATGYGLLYIVEEALKVRLKTNISGKKIVISGSGNVAIHAAKKAIDMGAIVLAMSDTSGVIIHEEGINLDDVRLIKQNKEPLQNYIIKHPNARFNSNTKEIWNIPAEIILPCATQDEIALSDAIRLVKNRVMLVAEGSNLALSNKAIDYLIKNKVLFIPGKASNSGGVAVSYFEMCQNKDKVTWPITKVDTELKNVMVNTFHRINEFAIKNNYLYDLRKASDLVAFLTIVKAAK